MSLFESLTELGENIEKNHDLGEFTADQFTELATRELSQYLSTCRYGEDDFVDEFFALEKLGPQMDEDGVFGSPPVTVFSGDGFVVDVYYWAKADTAIHSHAFCGAFALLSGQTLHVVNDFESGSQIYPNIALGNLKCKVVEILNPGDTRSIIQGPSFLHAAIHLANPTITLCVRSSRVFPGDQQQQGRQLVFKRPSLLHSGVNMGGSNNTLHFRQRTLLSELMVKGSPKLNESIRVFREKLGDEMALLNFIPVFARHLPPRKKALKILSALGLNKQDAKGVYRAFLERANNIRWQRIKTSEQKILAASLESGIGIDQIIALFQKANPEETADGETVCRVLAEISEIGALPVQLNGSARSVLFGMIVGMSQAELVEALAAHYQKSPEQDTQFKKDIARTYKTLKNTPIFSGVLEA